MTAVKSKASEEMQDPNPRTHLFEMSDVMERRRESGELYLEFLTASTMSVGVYALAAGSADPQRPHTEDEIYYVLDGRGRIRIDDDDMEVKPGSVIFVASGQLHNFHSITEDLLLLVVFAPARGTGAK